MNKTIKTNNYLLIDIGNSCIKAAIFNKKLGKCVTISNNTSFALLMKKLNNPKFNKVVIVSSNSEGKQYAKQIKKYCLDIHCITKKDFINDIDFSNIKKDVIIGNDILLCAYFLIKHYKANALLCLGTVYFSVITKGKKILSVHLIPNITTGLKSISKLTSIPESLLPEVYDKDIGLNTPDAFASGAKYMIEGYLDLLAKKYHLNTKQMIVSGGESVKYKSLSKKYTFNVYASLEALAYFVKDKNL